MLRGIQICCWSLLISNLLGCAICCTPLDDQFAAYGGLYERADMEQGRVASLFDPAPLATGGIAHDVPATGGSWQGNPYAGNTDTTSSGKAADSDTSSAKSKAESDQEDSDFEKRLQKFLPDVKPLPAVPRIDSNRSNDDDAEAGRAI